nr:uncharacterized protein LOC116147252 [Camelus dromedarius]
MEASSPGNTPKGHLERAQQILEIWLIARPTEVSLPAHQKLTSWHQAQDATGSQAVAGTSQESRVCVLPNLPTPCRPPGPALGVGDRPHRAGRGRGCPRAAPGVGAAAEVPASSPLWPRRTGAQARWPHRRARPPCGLPRRRRDPSPTPAPARRHLPPLPALWPRHPLTSSAGREPPPDAGAGPGGLRAPALHKVTARSCAAAARGHRKCRRRAPPRQCPRGGTSGHAGSRAARRGRAWGKGSSSGGRAPSAQCACAGVHRDPSPGNSGAPPRAPKEATPPSGDPSPPLPLERLPLPKPGPVSSFHHDSGSATECQTRLGPPRPRDPPQAPRQWREAMTPMRGLVEASGWPACPQTRAGAIPTGDGPAGLEQVSVV